MMVGVGRISSSSSQGEQMQELELPPGFRFHPTDEELIMHYLQKQVSISMSSSSSSTSCGSSVHINSIIPQVDIYKLDPWHLPDDKGAGVGENEWYFFTPRDRKYPNGARPNRAAVSGYWKATGTDKAIYSRSKYVGVKKALVFYKGKPPKGIKTDWIMHEYRLVTTDDQQPTTHVPFNHNNNSMRLDDWVLCRIYYKKKNNNTGRCIIAGSCNEDHQQTLNQQGCFATSPFASNNTYDDHLFPRTFNSLTHDDLRRDNHQLGFSSAPSHLLNRDTNNVQHSVAIKNEGFSEAGGDGDRFGQHMQHFQGQNNNNTIIDDHQAMFFNVPPVYELQ